MSHAVPFTGTNRKSGVTVCSPHLSEHKGSAVSPGGLNVLLPVEPTVDVSIVIPYYNPGDRLRPTLDHLLRVLTGVDLTFEVIAVSDGSTDGSPLTIDDFPEHLVTRICLESNAGKGYALRAGFGRAHGRYIGFIDADGDISPDFIGDFLSIIEARGADLVIGSKRLPGSSAENTGVRRFYSWGHQQFVRLLFRLDVSDTQVGIKLADRQLMAEVLPLLQERRFSLDLELLVLARRLGYTNVVEAPVRIEERSGSTISFRAVRKVLVDTFRIFWRSSVRRAYGPEPTMRGFHRPVAADPPEVITADRAVA
jgi:glycosyltransferase involved in cell wall biosynthesis